MQEPPSRRNCRQHLLGKGTVQRFFNLDDMARGYDDVKPLSLEGYHPEIYRHQRRGKLNLGLAWT